MHQDAFHEVDTYTSLEKQYLMMKLVLEYFDLASEALEKGAEIDKLASLDVRERIGRFKYVHQDNIKEEFKAITDALKSELSQCLPKEEL